MFQQTIRPTSSRNSLIQGKNSSLAPHFFATQEKPYAGEPHAQRETENGTFSQYLEQAARFGHHFANIPIYPPEAPASTPIQRKQMTDDESAASTEQRPNQTRLPDHLKAGVENLSGFSLDNVKVHYNSNKPAQVNALAYTQGTEIHVAPGQERHLAHEAWHVVQQAQGRVKPTMQLKGEVPVNDDEGLEREADVMGEKARTIKDVARTGDSNQEDTIPSSSAPQPTISGVVQRRVGFEFEDTYWRPWKRETTFSARRPAKRKEVIHQGMGFRMEGDDTPGPTESNIEFVTKPFDTTPQGLDELNTAMREIQAIEARIGPFAGRDETQGNFVTRQEHQLSNTHMVLSRGRQVMNLKMQATQGVSLENIPTMMKYFGTSVPNERAQVGQMRQGARALLPPGGAGDISDLIGSAPSFAVEIATSLVQRGLPGNTDQLKGFLTMIVLYIKALSMSQSGGGLKYNVPFLGRTNFAMMFRQLPLAQRTFLDNNNAQEFITAVIQGVNSRPVLRVNDIDIDVNFAAGGSLVRNLVDRERGTAGNRPVVFSSLTIGDWLLGITQGVDHLTPATITAWLKAHEPNLSRKERNRQADTFLESFATVGDDKTGRVTDAPERQGQSRLMIMENRIIQPTGNNAFDNGKMTAAQAHKVAYNYLRFFTSLRNRNGLHWNPRYKDDDPQ